MSGVSSGSLSRRYARALIETAKEAGQVDLFGAHLEALGTAFDQDHTLLHALASDSYPEAERSRAMTEIADKLGVHLFLKNFLLILVHKLRLNLFPQILHEYQVSRDEIFGIVRVGVVTAQTPSADLTSRIESLLSRKLGKKVICHSEVKPDILGGIVLKVNHMVYDGSIVRELERIKDRMLAA